MQFFKILNENNIITILRELEIENYFNSCNEIFDKIDKKDLGNE